MSRRILRGFDRSAFVTARDRVGLGPAELARIADVSAGAVYSWERGDATPGVDTLARVARALRIPIAELVPIPEDERFLGDLRVLAGLTQPQLAKLSGMSTSSLAQLERGQARIKVEVAQRIADACRRTRTTRPTRLLSVQNRSRCSRFSMRTSGCVPGRRIRGRKTCFPA
ncbi:helix-turn-helix domain-containing protein [Rhodococcus hoagii]|nr:helix-turn-helix domain-containing protein [Prescottella equi]